MGRNLKQISVKKPATPSRERAAMYAVPGLSKTKIGSAASNVALGVRYDANLPPPRYATIPRYVRGRDAQTTLGRPSENPSTPNRMPNRPGIRSSTEPLAKRYWGIATLR